MRLFCAQDTPTTAGTPAIFAVTQSSSPSTIKTRGLFTNVSGRCTSGLDCSPGPDTSGHCRQPAELEPNRPALRYVQDAQHPCEPLVRGQWLRDVTKAEHSRLSRIDVSLVQVICCR